MDIRCTAYRHLWGQSLMVDGKEIAFDHDGVCKGCDNDIAVKLIKQGGYADASPRETTQPNQVTPTPSSKRAKGGAAQAGK